jgi:hypothetical protein
MAFVNVCHIRSCLVMVNRAGGLCMDYYQMIRYQYR